ncbi:MAG TPA: GNAT family N-acetyltransferase [Kofleriaceae bacterium]|nr:GNAT family N-acetyltransferase [Kofleriaceae bacterium]
MLALPDLPRWVEAHGIAADAEGWREELGAGFALGHDRARLIVVAGEVEGEDVRRLAARPHVILVEREELALATGRAVERAILHALADASALPDYEGAVPLGDGPLPLGARALPAALADELAWARERGPVWSAWVDGEPACFAYAPWRSAGLFDVSVDTLPGARQMGLATIVAAAMIRDERSRGREPVWGANESNHASLRLAKRLGFEPVDEIWVCAPS